MRHAVTVLALSAALAGCSLTAREDPPDVRESGETAGGTVVLVTHESFNLPKALLKQFERESGYQLEVRAAGDAGTLTTKLAVTADNPTGDVAFGVDNTFASRALDEGVFDTAGVELPAGVADFVVPGDDGERLVPVDTGNVCVNVDTAWFAERDLAPPASLDDLTDPAYEGLFVTPVGAVELARARLPDDHRGGVRRGLAGLLGGPARQRREGRGRLDRRLLHRLHRPAAEDGTRPVVLSYDSSPAFTVPKGGGDSTTAALLDTCFRQVEYAGVLAGADNPDGARALVEFLLGEDVQAALPESMYVFPVRDGHRAAPGLGGLRRAAERPLRPRPGRDRRRPRRLARAVARHQSPGDPAMTRRLVGLAALALVPVLVLGAFFVVPVAGMVSLGLWPDGRFAPGEVVDVLLRGRTGRVLGFTLWSAAAGTTASVLLGLPAAYVLHRTAFPLRRFLRAALLVPFVLPTVVVGVAFRQLLGEGGPLGFLGLDGTPVAIVLGLVFFNVAVVIRVVGGAWESLDPRPAQAAATLGASPVQVFRTVTLPALRPAVVSAASVVFLFCATAFGIVLTLGGSRYATVETEIYLLTVQVFDLSAAAALSVLQLLVVVVLLLVAGRARATTPVARRPGRPRPLGRADVVPVLATLLLLAFVAAPIAALVAGSLRADGSWSLDNYAALSTTGDRQALQVSVTDALVNSLRTAVDATWMALGTGLLVALTVTRRSRSRTERRVRGVLDGLFMLPLGVSAVTLGFGFLITLDQPPLDLRDSPLLVPIAQALVALPLVARTLVPVLGGIDDRQRQAAASLGAGPLRTAGDGRPAGAVEAAAGRRGVRVRRLARGVRRDVVPRPRRVPDHAAGDLPAARPPRRPELRHGAGRLRRARRGDGRGGAARRAAARHQRGSLLTC